MSCACSVHGLGILSNYVRVRSFSCGQVGYLPRLGVPGLSIQRLCWSYYVEPRSLCFIRFVLYPLVQFYRAFLPVLVGSSSRYLRPLISITIISRPPKALQTNLNKTEIISLTDSHAVFLMFTSTFTQVASVIHTSSSVPGLCPNVCAVLSLLGGTNCQ